MHRRILQNRRPKLFLFIKKYKTQDSDCLEKAELIPTVHTQRGGEKSSAATKFSICLLVAR